MRSLQELGIESKNYDSLLAPIMLERLPHQLKLIISQNLKSEIWALDKTLLLINEKLRAPESCIIPRNSFNSVSTDEQQGGNIICHILRVQVVGLYYILTRRTKICVYFALITIGPISVW